MILEGDYDALSIAMYGKPAGSSEVEIGPRSPMVLDYEPFPLSSIPKSRQLPISFDPARTPAPTQIAVQLLAEDYPDWKIEAIVRQLIAESHHNPGRIVNGDASFDKISESLERCISDNTTDPEDWLDDAVQLSRSPFLASVPELADRFIDRLNDALGTIRVSLLSRIMQLNLLHRC